ncbi:MAG: carbohydrate ABC transporter permease [Eisenbergiella sp.]
MPQYALSAAADFFNSAVGLLMVLTGNFVSKKIAGQINMVGGDIVKENADTKQGVIRVLLLFCLMSQLLILGTEVIDKQHTVGWHGIFRIIFLMSFLVMFAESIYRMILFKDFRKYIKFNRAEILWIFISCITIPVAMINGNDMIMLWVCLLKMPNILGRFKDETVFQVIVKIIAVLLIIFFVVPFLNVIAKAISSPASVVSILPKDIDWFAMDYVLSDKAFLKSFGNSIFITIVGTLLSVVSMAMAAYPLSKPYMPLRKTMTVFFLIVMLFSGGIAPHILVMNALGLIDTIWALILPSVVMVYYMLLLKGFFEGVPEELEESAKLDGARNMDIFFKIYMPMSAPMVATVGFFTAISYWNNINNSILYVTSNKSIYPVPMYIKNFMGLNPMEVAMNNPKLLSYWDGIEMSYILMSIVPIACIYPFVFKYLKNDISAGAVKG